MLATETIVKKYGDHLALDGVSIEVPTGKVFGLLGPNGAGKTTLIRIITRITGPDSGKVLLNGRPMTEADVATMGYLPEERGLYKKMKAVSYTHLRAHETVLDLVCRLLLEKKKNKNYKYTHHILKDKLHTSSTIPDKDKLIIKSTALTHSLLYNQQS